MGAYTRTASFVFNGYTNTPILLGSQCLHDTGYQLLLDVRVIAGLLAVLFVVVYSYKRKIAQKKAKAKEKADKELAELKEELARKLAEEKETGARKLAEEKEIAARKLAEEKAIAARRLTEEKEIAARKLAEEKETGARKLAEEKEIAARKLAEEIEKYKRQIYHAEKKAQAFQAEAIKAESSENYFSVFMKVLTLALQFYSK
jgi:FtsZ-interacting cell division protein ZipA